MKKLLLLVCCALSLQHVFAQATVKCDNPCALDAMPQHVIDYCWTEYQAALALAQVDSAGAEKQLVKKGSFYGTLYRYTGVAAKKPKTAQVMKYYAAYIKKKGGVVYSQSATHVDAMMKKDGTEYWLNIAEAQEKGMIRLSVIVESNGVVDEVSVG